MGHHWLEERFRQLPDCNRSRVEGNKRTEGVESRSDFPDASVDHTDARKATVRRFGRSDRSAQCRRLWSGRLRRPPRWESRTEVEWSEPPRIGPTRGRRYGLATSSARRQQTAEFLLPRLQTGRDRERKTQWLRLPAESDARRKAGGEDVSLQPDGGRAPSEG